MGKISNKQRNVIVDISVILIALLLIVPPYIKNIDFKLNSEEIYGVVTSISPYQDAEGDTYYKVTVLYKVDNQLYKKTFSYGDMRGVEVNKKQKLIYYTKDPTKVTTRNDTNMGFDGIKIIIGNLLFCFLFIKYLIIMEGSLSKKRKSQSFIKNFNDDVKLTFIYTSASIFFLIITAFITHLGLLNDTPLNGIQYFWVFWPIIFLVVGIIQIIFLIKVRNL